MRVETVKMQYQHRPHRQRDISLSFVRLTLSPIYHHRDDPPIV
jgi:hypothetical protein